MRRKKDRKKEKKERKGHIKNEHRRKIYLPMQNPKIFSPASVAQWVECPLRDREVPGSILGRNIPKSLTMVLVAPRLALGFSG